MQVALLISLIMLCTGGCIASTYEVEAKKRGWPVSPYYQLYGVMTTIGTIFTLGSIIISFVSNPWWTGIIVIIAGLILSQILINIFKQSSQKIAAIIIIISLGFTIYFLLVN